MALYILPMKRLSRTSNTSGYAFILYQVIRGLSLATILGIASAANAQNDKSFRDAVWKEVSNQGTCKNGVVEAFWTSDTLKSPDGSIEIYFKGINRRQGGYRVKKNKHCYPENTDTPLAEMFLNEKKVPMSLKLGATSGRHIGENSLYVIQPLSFSSDNRFVFAKVEATQGLSGFAHQVVVDVTNSKVSTLDVCPNGQFGATFSKVVAEGEQIIDGSILKGDRVLYWCPAGRGHDTYFTYSAQTGEVAELKGLLVQSFLPKAKTIGSVSKKYSVDKIQLFKVAP